MKRLFARPENEPILGLLAPAAQDIFDALRPAAVQLVWFAQPFIRLYQPQAEINALVDLLDDPANEATHSVHTQR